MIRRLVFNFMIALWSATAVAQPCSSESIQLQVLGSGGPELIDQRASSSYLVWIDGKPRALVDVGGGAALRFSEAGGKFADLDVILLTHLHVDHSGDLPALVKMSAFETRNRPLPIYGPTSNRITPSTVTFVRTLFDGKRGGYRYLSDFLNPLTRRGYKLQPHDVRRISNKLKVVRESSNEILTPFANERLRTSAVLVNHGTIPALAWRIDIGTKSIVFSGDSDGEGGSLESLARGADLLVAHNAIPEEAGAVERSLYMPPSRIGRIANKTAAKQLVLSHRMRRTLGRETETLNLIEKYYAGPTAFANDLDCFTP